MNQDLQTFMSFLKDTYPDFYQTIDQTIDLESETALTEIFQLLIDRPEISTALAEKLLSEPSYTDVEESQEAPLALRTDKSLGDFTEENIILSDKAGSPRLNPIFEGLLMERLQFDGDVPELRSGALVDASHVSVAIDTTVSNPILLGSMIKSTEERLKHAYKSNKEEALALLMEENSKEEVSLVKSRISLEEASPEELKGSFGRGAPLVKSDYIESKSIFSLTKKERTQNAWKSFSSSQGRRSAIKAIEHMVYEHFANKDLQVNIANIPEYDLVFDWTTTLQDKESFQPKLSFISMVAKIFIKKIENKISSKDISNLTFKVSSINEIADRRVGWTIRLKT